MASTISTRNQPETIRRFELLKRDNTGIAKRPMYKTIVTKIEPEVERLFRSTKLPSGLAFQEKKFYERKDQPRSIYKYSVLMANCAPFREIGKVKDTGYVNPIPLNHPWLPSVSFTLELDLERNKRAMGKGAGPPKYGKKRDQLAAALQYVQNVVFPSPVITNMYSIFPGWRTQQSDPNEPKVRLVWMVSITQWLIECMALDSAITRTMSLCGGKQLDVYVLYTRISKLTAWLKHKFPSVIEWANLDASQYDASVTAAELSAACEFFFPEFEFKDLLRNTIIDASLMLPDGDMLRHGGQPSGSKSTNLFDGWTNVRDLLDVLARLGLMKFVVCIIVNGDDISIGFSTRLTEKNKADIAKYSRRNLNVEKSIFGEYIWNSKYYIDEDICTRPIWRVINSAKFKEHQMNPITGSREYTEIALASQLEDVIGHPLGQDVINLFAKNSKYHISTMSADQLREAADAYIDDHNWREWYLDADDLLDDLRRSAYAKASV